MAPLLRNQRISTGEKAVPSRPVPKRCTKKSARSTAQLMPAIASAARPCMHEALCGNNWHVNLQGFRLWAAMARSLQSRAAKVSLPLLMLGSIVWMPDMADMTAHEYIYIKTLPSQPLKHLTLVVLPLMLRRVKEEAGGYCSSQGHALCSLPNGLSRDYLRLLGRARHRTS